MYAGANSPPSKCAISKRSAILIASPLRFTTWLQLRAARASRVSKRNGLECSGAGFLDVQLYVYGSDTGALFLGRAPPRDPSLCGRPQSTPSDATHHDAGTLTACHVERLGCSTEQLLSLYQSLVPRRPQSKTSRSHPYIYILPWCTPPTSGVSQSTNSGWPIKRRTSSTRRKEASARRSGNACKRARYPSSGLLAGNKSRRIASATPPYPERPKRRATPATKSQPTTLKRIEHRDSALTFSCAGTTVSRSRRHASTTFIMVTYQAHRSGNRSGQQRHRASVLSGC